MLIIRWIYELTIILYALSVLGYFMDFLQHNRKVNRIAFWLLSIVWILQSVFLVTKMLELSRFPILTVFEGLYFYAWILLTFSLIINRIFRIDFFVFFTNVIAFFLMALHLFAPQQHSAALAEQLVSELLIIHITMAILSYGAFSFSFVFSMMYLLQYDMLKQKKWTKRLRRLGDLSKLDRMSFYLTMLGVPMLLLALLLGILWATVNPAVTFHWYDMKIIGSFLVLFIYSFYLYLRVGRDIQGRTVAIWNAAAFLILLINFFLLGSLSKFHFWYV